jgi:TRAP-type C4-dicarboxylate transport system permease small subunit
VLWVTTAVIFVILCANTVLRYTTGSSLQWANELPELLFPWLVMAGVVLAAQQGSHIATTFLRWTRCRPPAAALGRGWLAVAACTPRWRYAT